MPNVLLVAALGYAALGFAVVPLHTVDANGACSCKKGARCDRPGKHPRVTYKDWTAPPTEQAIRRYWRKWPNANVGILTGARSGDLLVVDVDGPDGERALAELQAKAGATLPRTRTVRTGRDGGGRQLYFRASREFKNTVGSRGGLGRGLDTRSRGGLAVAPPSRHKSGRAYETIDTSAIAPCPAWLEKLLEGLAPASQVSPAGTGTRPVRPSGKSGRDTPALDALHDVREGERNNAIYKAACSDRARWADDTAVQKGCVRAAQRCVPPLDRGAALGIAASACRYEPGPSGASTKAATSPSRRPGAATPHDGLVDRLQRLPDRVRSVYFAVRRQAVTGAPQILKLDHGSRRLNLYNGQAWVTQDGLAQKCRCSKMTVRRALTTLREAGLVTWDNARGCGLVITLCNATGDDEQSAAVATTAPTAADVGTSTLADEQPARGEEQPRPAGFPSSDHLVASPPSMRSERHTGSSGGPPRGAPVQRERERGALPPCHGTGGRGVDRSAFLKLLNGPGVEPRTGESEAAERRPPRGAGRPGRVDRDPGLRAGTADLTDTIRENSGVAVIENAICPDQAAEAAPGRHPRASASRLGQSLPPDVLAARERIAPGADDEVWEQIMHADPLEFAADFRGQVLAAPQDTFPADFLARCRRAEEGLR